MTASQKIKRELMLSALEFLNTQGNLDEKEKTFAEMVEQGITEETVDIQYDAFMEADLHQDYESDFRGGQVETNLPCDYSRNYEAKSVASKLSDGSWVGWTCWYGGGKHGDPGAIEWIEDAYDLEVTEVEKLVLVREYKKVADAQNAD